MFYLFYLSIYAKIFAFYFIHISYYLFKLEKKNTLILIWWKKKSNRNGFIFYEGISNYDIGIYVLMYELGYFLGCLWLLIGVLIVVSKVWGNLRYCEYLISNMAIRCFHLEWENIHKHAFTQIVSRSATSSYEYHCKTHHMKYFIQKCFWLIQHQH